MTAIKNRNLDQLKAYADWDKRQFPDDKNRQHVLDWAVQEITRLRDDISAPRIVMSSVTRRELIRIAAEIVRLKYSEDPTFIDERLSELAINLRDVADSVAQQGFVLSKRTARFQVLRESMSEIQWRDFCYEHPEAKSWFDNCNVPT